MKGSRYAIGTVVIGALLAAIAAGTASAHGDATCGGLGGIGGGLDWPPAGQVGAAVQANGGGAATPGGPGPGFHFTIPGLAPGASFCNEQAHPNGFDTPDRFTSR